MILHLTDSEALALSQRLTVKTQTVGDGILEGIGGVTSAGPTLTNIEALESAKAKLRAAMQKSDAKLGRSLDYAISSLESSGFDSDQLEALRGAKDKVALHNDKKYKQEDGLKQRPTGSL